MSDGMMFNRTITLFNLHEDTWYPTVLRDCCLICDKAARQAATGLENADSANLYIRESSINEAGVQVVGSREYAALNRPSGYITFQEGKDFFAEGEYSGTVSDDDYQSGYYHYLNKTRDGVYLITSAAGYDLIPHYEVTGK